jgi:DNA polymerase III alpha subunit
MDILDWLYQRCPTPEIRERVVEELRLFAKHDMIPVLKTMKYIVDTLRANNIVWGVGRGSSVASYVLFLLGVHKIDSLYYNLDIDEFLK